MSNLGLSKKVQKKHQSKDACNNIDPVHVRLESNNYGSLLALSDDFFYYCLTRETISDKTLIDRRNDIIKELDGNTVLNNVSYTKRTEFFNYERLCDENYDLTSEENILLWIINGFCTNSFPKQIGDLYKTTKVFLDVSNGKDLKEADWSEDEDDLLGYYTILPAKHPGPKVWLIMDKITAEAERLCCDRKYIIAKVYIHEMMHRFYDLRPDLRWKRSVKEIEEPMAEFATLKFIEELSKQNASFEKLLPIAIVMTEGLRKSEKHFIYALGVDLYYKAPIELIYDYQRISMLLHRSSEDYKPEGEKLDPSPMKYVEDYIAQCEQNKDSLANLVGPIRNCIETYAKFFSQDKGTK